MDNSPVWTPEDLAAQSRSAATWRAYQGDWRSFTNWCAERGFDAMPADPTTIGSYIADQGRRRKPTTVERHLSAILVHHRLAGHPLSRHHPAIGEVLRGLRRAVKQPPQGKAPLQTEDVRNLVACLPRTLAGTRDAALILVGFASACRRSELAALTTRDLLWSSEGVVITVRHGKEDQEGVGMLKTIPFGQAEATCPVRALRRWVLAARLDDGPLFRRIDRHDRLHADGLSGEAVGEIVRRAVQRWGRHEGWSEADIVEAVAQTGAHSLRSGFVTSAVSAGATEWEAMLVTGHKSASMVRRYARPATGFRHSAIRRLGL